MTIGLGIIAYCLNTEIFIFAFWDSIKGIKRENFQEEIPEMGFFRKKKHQYHFGGDRIISFGKDLINFREDKILYQLKKSKIDLKWHANWSKKVTILVPLTLLVAILCFSRSIYSIESLIIERAEEHDGQVKCFNTDHFNETKNDTLKQRRTCKYGLWLCKALLLVKLGSLWTWPRKWSNYPVKVQH